MQNTTHIAHLARKCDIKRLCFNPITKKIKKNVVTVKNMFCKISNKY